LASQQQEIEDLRKQGSKGASAADLRLLRDGLAKAEETVKEMEKQHRKKLEKEKNKYIVLVEEYEKLKESERNGYAKIEELKGTIGTRLYWRLYWRLCNRGVLEIVLEIPSQLCTRRSRSASTKLRWNLQYNPISLRICN
jgi:hypothetical protein